MSTPAVTPAESASAPVVETPEVSLQVRLNEATPEEYKTWQRTGDIPAVKPRSAEPPPKPETPAVSKESSAVEAGEDEPPAKIESAAVAEPAKPQKKRNGDARILQLLEERKQEREEFNRRLEDFERRLAKPAEPSAKSDSQPAAAQAEIKAESEPLIDGINPKTGKQFQTIAEWQKEHTEWMREQIRSETRGELTKSEQQRAQAEQQRVQNEGLAAKLLVGKDKYPDFEKIALNPEILIPNGSAADVFIRNSENAADVLYYLGQHPEVLSKFYRYVPGKDDKPGQITGKFEQLIHPTLQVMELARIEARLGSPVTPSPAPKVSPAPSKPLPPPPTVLSARSSPSSDAVEEALSKKSYADYEKAANERERKGRRA